MVYGSETWETRLEDMNRLVRAERSMVRAMCRVSLKDGKSSEELLSRLGIVSVVKIVERGRLWWFGHVERKMAEDWVSKSRELKVDGGRGSGIGLSNGGVAGDSSPPDCRPGGTSVQKSPLDY